MTNIPLLCSFSSFFFLQTFLYYILFLLSLFLLIPLKENIPLSYANSRHRGSKAHFGYKIYESDSQYSDVYGNDYQHVDVYENGSPYVDIYYNSFVFPLKITNCSNYPLASI